ncbi:class I SAM-dependent methyltransferase [Roseiconus nitratireducens]|uniref:Class I SAM-dependent methyltransferase n=1 Tax=Roseiconus nitratireducens TaxID=2605748 RepID=A0A5M6CVC6_9BACT|nr:class I SAM-dependent methyltransferase [Roseiconus nitratireducens]KAA5538896.1 class I SAM-dependent methyltransferase [Roseiconus nitratireducens]
MNPSEPRSRVADCTASFLFTGRILGKYDVNFYRCDETGFIQTEEPYWLEEAYADVIAQQDSGLLARCLAFRTVTSLLIKDNFEPNDEFLDYGGGYGVFTRLMRDDGYAFHHYDPMCQNLFATDFGADLSRRYAAITAFEVFEHLSQPREVLRELLDSTDVVFFSTVLQPSPPPESIDSWYYFHPEIGQHISFFNLASLQSLARQFDCSLYSNGSTLHAISKRPLSFSAARPGMISKIRRAVLRASRA